MRPQIPCIDSLLLACMLAFAGAMCPAAGIAADTEIGVIPGYDSYESVGFLEVSVGSVKVKRLGEKGWHVVIELPTGETPRRVTLSAEGLDFMRLLPLRGGGGRLAQPGNRIEVIVPADGVGWFFLLNPIPEVSVREYKPKSLFKLPDNTPEKAKYPVVDIHAYLRGVSVDERLKVMDAVGVAMVVDCAKLAEIGIPPNNRTYRNA